MEREKQKSSARRNIYFSKDNMDLYEYLDSLGYKGSNFACLAIRRLIEESLTDEELNNIKSPSNDMLLFKLKTFEENQIRRQELMKEIIIREVTKTLFSEIDGLKEMIRGLQDKIKQGVVLSDVAHVDNRVDADDGVAELVDTSEMADFASGLLDF